MTFVLWLGSEPNLFGAGENIFESVFNSTWTSSPITVSKFMPNPPLQLWFLLMIVCRLFKCMSNTIDCFFVKMFTDKDRKSTRLNSSHVKISYAVFCLKKKKKKNKIIINHI